MELDQGCCGTATYRLSTLAGAAGSTTSTHVPSVQEGLNCTSPAWRRTMRLEIARPAPTPRTLASALNRQNIRNAFS
jgi:hypothetical protein